MKISHFTKIIGGALAATALLACSSRLLAKAETKSPTSLKNVYFLYVDKWSGDKGFARRTQRDIAQLGFQWTRDRQKAHALLGASTRWKNGAFWGELIFRDQNQRVIWHDTAYRPRSSNYMASDRLIDKLRRDVKAARAE